MVAAEQSPSPGAGGAVDEADASLQQALVLHRGGWFREAMPFYRRILKEQPGNLDALNLGGIAAYQTGDTRQALEWLGTAVVLEADFSDAQYHLGIVLESCDRTEEAAEAFSRAAAAGADDADTLCALARTLKQLNRFEESIATYGRAAGIRPQDAGILCGQGMALKAAGRLDDAASTYRRALEISPDHAETLCNLGILMQSVGRLEDAIALFRQAGEVSPDAVEALNCLGNALRVSRRLDEAAEAYRRASDVRPGYVAALDNLGTVLSQLGKVDQAVAAHRAALQADPANAPLYCNLGATLQAAGRMEQAITAFRDALEVAPDHPQALANLAIALKAVGRIDEVLPSYHRALEACPDSVRLLHYFATAQYMRGDLPAAARACDDCLALSPAYPSAIALKVIALSEMGETERFGFISDFDRLIRPTRIQAPDGFASLTAFNAALADHVCSHPSLRFEPPSQATRRGSHTGELLFGEIGPIAALESAIRGAVEDYRESLPEDPAHPFLAYRPRSWKLTIWSVVMGAQGYQIPHIHPAAWLSGCYYAKVPDEVSASGDRHAGWIEFGGFPQEYACVAEPETRLYQPEEGLLLLFPSFMYHQTVPYESEETRISIAFDILPQD